MQVNIRQHALESGCFVVNASAWLDADQQAQIMKDTGCNIGPISSGCFTAIVSPEGELMGEPLRSGEGVVIADLDFALIDERKQMMDSRGHYSRPELLSCLLIAGQQSTSTSAPISPCHWLSRRSWQCEEVDASSHYQSPMGVCSGRQSSSKHGFLKRRPQIFFYLISARYGVRW